MFNHDQDIAIVATVYDVLYVNMKKKHEVDIDRMFHINNIRSIISVGKKFYVLANKQEKQVSYYLIEIDEKGPIARSKPAYLINWKNKLDIGDAQMYMMSDI